MDTTLLNILTRIEIRIGENFRINSAYRTRRHNSKVGGSERSIHMEGGAVDIRALSNELRYKIVEAAILEGVPHIGISERFIHLDIGNNRNKDNKRLWLYGH